MRKGSKEAKAWGAKMRRLRNPKVYKSRSSGYSMAKKRKSYKRGKSSNFSSSNLMNTALGVGGYILFESMIEPKIISMLNISNPLVINAGELAMGLYLSKKSGIVGNIGKTAVIINAYQILFPYLSSLNLGMAQSTNGIVAYY
jgi:hypothetical protein